jgi:HPt (histidine-containing phosphotransfer) domain-containing protein
MDVLDRQQLIQNVDGDPELLEEIVSLFFESSGEILTALRDSVRSADGPGLHASAHQLKGALANVGARAAAQAAYELERMGKAGELTRLEEALTSLEEEMDRLEPELRGLVRSTRG